MKLDFDGKKCRVLYDGKEFNKVKDGYNICGEQSNESFYSCYYKGEDIPTDEYMWEQYEFPEEEED